MTTGPTGLRSLRFQIMAALVSLTLLLGVGGTLRARSDLAAIGRAELEKRAITIARDLAVQHVDQVLVNDIFGLYELVNDFLLNNADLRYIFIMSPGGSVLVSSFEGGVPEGLWEVNIPQPQAIYQAQRIRTEEGIIYDVAMPILEGRAGTVRVGLLETPLAAQVNRQTVQLLGLTVTATLLGAILAYMLGTFLTRPLAQLIEITKAVARGDLSQKAPGAFQQEVNQLSTAFNVMTEALARSQDQLVRRNEELSTLNAVAVAVSRSLDLQEILDGALEQVLALMKLPAGWVFLSDGPEQRLSLAAWRGIPVQWFTPQSDDGRADCICCQVLRAGRARLVETIGDCPRLGRMTSRGEWPACHASVPLQSRNQVFGIMNLVCRPEGCPLTREELHLLTTIGHQIGVAVENARLYQELQRKEALRGQLLEKVIMAQEDERLRIARELHDEAGQALSALSMGLGAAHRALPPGADRAREILEDLKAQTVEVVGRIRSLTVDLRPSLLDDLGLVSALRHYTQDLSQRSGTKILFEVRGLKGRLPAQVETALFRIVQEALTNVTRHAAARTAWVRLEQDETALTVSIEDDGQGFNPDEMVPSRTGGKGLGLLGMQERATLLGGVLHIDSQIGQGTRVSVRLPLVEAVTDGSDTSIGGR